VRVARSPLVSKLENGWGIATWWASSNQLHVLQFSGGLLHHHFEMLNLFFQSLGFCRLTPGRRCMLGNRHVARGVCLRTNETVNRIKGNTTYYIYVGNKVKDSSCFALNYLPHAPFREICRSRAKPGRASQLLVAAISLSAAEYRLTEVQPIAAWHSFL
jgi:hypothetical protein